MELTVGILVIALVLIVGVLAMASKEGRAIGLVDNKLAPCPPKVNCICSEDPDDSEHYITPFVIPPHITNVERLGVLVKNLISELGGDVQLESYTYIAAVFTSSLWGFSDDFEVRIDTDARKIHFRSASRAGYSDFGVNKKRVQRLISLLESRLSPKN